MTLSSKLSPQSNMGFLFLWFSLYASTEAKAGKEEHLGILVPKQK